MSLLLRTLESPCLRRWACFERHRALTNALSLSKPAPAWQPQAFQRFRNEVHESSRLVVGEAEAGLDFGEGGGADAFDFEEVVGLGEGAGGDDAFGEFGADFGEGAEGFDGGGVDVDGGRCGIFA